MQDLAHVMTDDNLFVWDFDPKKGDLKTVDGMETALLVSLFTDARLVVSIHAPVWGATKFCK